MALRERGHRGGGWWIKKKKKTQGKSRNASDYLKGALRHNSETFLAKFTSYHGFGTFTRLLTDPYHYREAIQHDDEERSAREGKER